VDFLRCAKQREFHELPRISHKSQVHRGSK
jgi:hypothetical protein